MDEDSSEKNKTYKLQYETLLICLNTFFRTEKEQQYAKLGSDLHQLIMDVSNVDSPQSERIKAIDKMKQILDECLTISDLDTLTAIYRYTTPNTAINVGYDAQAVAKFVTDLIDKYPSIQSDK